MKLSQVRKEFDEVAQGQWFHWRGTIFVRVRGFQSRAYQRELRIASADVPPVKEGASGEEQIARSEEIGRRLLPHIARLVIADWWGMDEESEPVALDVAEKPTLVATVAGIRLETLVVDGKYYRPEGERWQEMVPYSAERAEAILRDERCADFMQGVRDAASLVDIGEVAKQTEELGKLLRSSSGKSATAIVPKK